MQSAPFALITVAIGCQKSHGQSPETDVQAAPALPAPAATNSATANGDPVLVGAGDVANCDELAGAKATAKLLDSIPGTVFGAGDLAYWHHPLFSSGLKHGNDPEVKPVWQDLYAANADLIVNGHDHDYERFAAQDPDGKLDTARGIREFVVGSGSENSHRSFGKPQPNSEIRNGDTFGVLKLTLHANSYD